MSSAWAAAAFPALAGYNTSQEFIQQLNKDARGIARPKVGPEKSIHIIYMHHHHMYTYTQMKASNIRTLFTNGHEPHNYYRHPTYGSL